MRIAAGQRLELEVDTDKTRGQLFESETICLEANRLLIAHPREGRFFAPIRSGSKVSVGYARGSAFLTFDTIVIGSVEHEGQRALVLEPPVYPPLVVDQRQAFRTDAQLPVRVEVLTSPDETRCPPGAKADLTTKDVSPLGTGILSPHPYPEGTEVIVELQLREVAVEVTGTVARCVQKAMSSPKTWLVGIRFSGAEHLAAAAIRRFVQQVQRDQGSRVGV